MSYFLIFYLTISLLGFFMTGMMIWHMVRMSTWSALYQFVQAHRYTIWMWYYGLFGMIPVASILSYAWSNFYYNPLLAITYTLSVWGLSMGGYLLAASIMSWVLGFIFLLYRHITTTPSLSISNILLPFLRDFNPVQKFIIILPVLLAIGLVIYGTINASTVRVTRYNLSASAGAYPLPSSWIGKNITLYSDTHIGTIRGKKFLSRVVEKINEQNPYITLMAGDLVDGPRFPHHYLEPLAGLRSEMGNYYTPGNHEEYSRDMALSGIIDQYLTRVSDSTTIVDGVALVGMSYEREPMDTFITRLQQIISRDPAVITMPSIGILHDPKNIKGLLDLSPNLTVSGHTHGGQMWPGNLIVKKIYGMFGYGSSLHNDNTTLHITTSGAGSAQSPVRIGTRAEIVVIQITE